MLRARWLAAQRSALPLASSQLTRSRLTRLPRIWAFLSSAQVGARFRAHGAEA